VILSLGDAHDLSEKIALDFQNKGISVDQISVTRIDEKTLEQIAKLLEKVEFCITVENHLITGGLGSLVCEAVATSGLSTLVFRIGVEELPISEYGDHKFLQKRFMTDTRQVVEAVCWKVRS
jgi:transketolase